MSDATEAPGPVQIGADWSAEQVAEFRDAVERIPPGTWPRLLNPPQLTPPPPPVFDYHVVITWPATGPGRMISIHDAETGDQIYAVTRLAVYADASGIIWAQAEMLLGSDGRPSRLTGGPLADVVTGEDGEPVTGVFSLLVTEMRVAPPPEHVQMPAGPSA